MKYLIGIGNYTMGDDGIGLKLVEHIAEHELNRDFEVIDLGDDGSRLLDYFSPETERMLLVDCVKAGKKPGEYFFFKPEDVESKKHLSAMTTHEGDILKVIELGHRLGLPIPPIEVMGIEPESMKMGMELSGTLTRRFDEYVKTAINRISPPN
jgi:hydrogenase maturation protease